MRPPKQDAGNPVGSPGGVSPRAAASRRLAASATPGFPLLWAHSKHGHCLDYSHCLRFKEYGLTRRCQGWSGTRGHRSAHDLTEPAAQERHPLPQLPQPWSWGTLGREASYTQPVPLPQSAEERKEGGTPSSGTPSFRLASLRAALQPFSKA